MRSNILASNKDDNQLFNALNYYKQLKRCAIPSSSPQQTLLSAHEYASIAIFNNPSVSSEAA